MADVSVVGHTSWEQLEANIRNVPLLQERDGQTVYPYADAVIELAEVAIAETLPSTLYVVRPNLRFQRSLAASLREHDVDPLQLDGGVTLEDANGETHGLIPPMIEDTPEHPRVFFDGQHRIYNARMDSIKSVVAIMISQVDPESPLYAHPNEWHEIVEYDEAPTDPSLKKKYRVDDPYRLYRNLGGLNGSKPRTS